MARKLILAAVLVAAIFQPAFPSTYDYAVRIMNAVARHRKGTVLGPTGAEETKAAAKDFWQIIYDVTGKSYENAVEQKEFLATNVFLTDSYPDVNFTTGTQNLLDFFSGLPELLPSTPSVSTFSQGISQFLLDRAQQELMIAFLEDLKRGFRNYPEIQTLFPDTSEYMLSVLANSNVIQGVLNVRPVFQQDLTLVGRHVLDIGSIPLEAEEGTSAQSRWLIYSQFWQSDSGLLLRLAIRLSYSINTDDSVLSTLDDLIPELLQNPRSEVKDIGRYMGVVSFLGKSIVTADSEVSPKWISATQLHRLLNDQDLQRYFLGILYEQAKRENQDVEKFLSDNKADLGAIIGAFQSFFIAYQRLGSAIDEIKLAKEDASKTAAAIAHYLRELTGLFASTQTAISKLLVIQGDVKVVASMMEDLQSIIKTGNEVINDVNDGNYVNALAKNMRLVDKVLDSVQASDYASVEELKSRLKALDPDDTPAMNLSASIALVRRSLATFSSLTAWVKAMRDSGLYVKIDSYFDPLLDSLDQAIAYLDKEKKSLERVKSPKEIAFIIESLRTIGVKKVADVSTELNKLEIKDSIIAIGASIPAMKKVMTTYGPFLAALSKADSPEVVKQVLTDYAAPSTSYRIKHENSFDIELAAYLGVMASSTFGVGGTGPIKSSGFLTPVGISLNWGLDKTNAQGWSGSVFLGIIDIGALTTLQLGNGDDSLPDLVWANILAPSVYWVFGIAKTPISLGLGTQWGPGFQGSGTSVSSLSDYGFRGLCAFIAVDIPILILYVKK